ncbi:nitroreductase family protein [Staphylospora marina]|uniref:nitroreductase family protein n=1 Tax=Staphylospora marina TaxID=2490858 RepID=UPI000F5BEA22|nr:nitroreductase family protein [Staphylospora marina]
MSVRTEQSAIDVMKARGSVKKYEPGVEIPEEELREILELAGRAPSSWNLQHWKYLVITSREMKEKVLPIAYNQQQVVDSSATVVILGDLEADKNFETVYKPAVDNGTLPQNVYDALHGQVEAAYQNPQLARDEAILNASLSAMQLMLAAKAKGWDTCPMGGFDKKKLTEVLNIPPRYIPVMLIVIGKPAAPARPSSRIPVDKLIIRESF